MAVNILLKRSATASKRPVGASMAFGELNLNYDAATGGLFYKDSLGAVVKVGPCQVSATAPNSSPAGSSGNSTGEFWFDTSTQTLKLYDGTTWVEAGGMVQGVTGTAPITVDNSDPLNPVIGVDAASTTDPGVVQLNNTTSSTSTSEALTAAQGKNLQDQIDALVVTSNLTLAGTLDASTGNLVTVTAEGAGQSFVVGDPLPAAAAGNSEFFVIATVAAASYTPPGGSAVEVHVGDWFLSNGTVWNFLDVGFQAPYASTTTAGIVQLATDAEVQAGVNTDHAVTPSGLQSKVSDSVSTTSSITLASSTAAKTAYDAGVQGQTDAAAAQATADAALPKAGGEMTGNIVLTNSAEITTDATADLSLLAGSGMNFLLQSLSGGGQIDAQKLSIYANSTDTDAFYIYSPGTGTIELGTANLVTGNGLQINGDAGTAGYILQSNGSGAAPTWVPQSEGDVTSVSGSAPITVDNTDPQNPIVGIDAATTASSGAVQLNDTVTSTSDTEAATANAVKTAYDAAVAAQGDATQALSDAAAAQATADAALPKAGGTMTGNITFQDAGEGVVFSDASSVTGISNSVSTTSSTTAASSTAVKLAYDTAVAAAAAGDVAGIASDTVIFVNSTDGSDVTGQRGTTKAFLTINAALAVALNGDTIFLSPGTFTENVTLTKGVNMVGTYNEQGMAEGTSISGNFVYNMATPAATVNPTINNIRFVSTNTSNAFKVLSNSFVAGGIGTINDCSFTQAGDSSTTEFCFETAGTWTRSLYVRRATFDGNVKHAAGTAAGASGYLVLDDILATGSATRHYNISTGTVEFRRPSNAISPVLQTGGVVLFTDCISGISPSNATTSPIFGGTNISYKGSAASVGTGTVYFNGYAPISGAIQIGANLVYGWSALNVTPANLTISGSAVAYTTAVPAAAATVTASQQRPRFDLLTATSSVAAANQLATVVDSANGTFYTVAALDAGTF